MKHTEHIATDLLFKIEDILDILPESDLDTVQAYLVTIWTQTDVTDLCIEYGYLDDTFYDSITALNLFKVDYYLSLAKDFLENLLG